MESCDFCRIAAGELPVQILWRADGFLAFADHDPINPGHLLLVPARHVRELWELSGDELAALSRAAAALSRALAAATGADGVTLAQNGGTFNDVGHLRLHLIPRFSGDGFGWAGGRGGPTTPQLLAAISIALADPHKQGGSSL